METTKILNISEHALEQYVARIKKSETRNEQMSLLGKYRDKYKEELNKLFNSSELYYTGMLGNANKNVVSVFINKDGWVLLTDQRCDNLITLYKPDLEVDDEEFNRAYVSKSLEKIKKEKENADKIKEITSQKRKDLLKEVDELEFKISEYNSLVNDFKKRIESCRNQAQNLDADIREATMIYRETVENFCAKDRLK